MFNTRATVEPLHRLLVGPSKCGIKKAEFDIKDHNQVKGHLRKYGLTKRMYLKVSKSLFDPMGLLTPISQSFNLLFREILMGHSSNNKWDTKLDTEYITPFCELMKSLFYVKNNFKVR